MDEHPYFRKEITSQEDIESVPAALQLTVWAIQACDGAPETSPFCEDVRCHTVSGCYAARLSCKHSDLFIFVVPKRKQKRIFTEASERERSQVKTTAQIFLCYAQEDKKKIENLYQKLSDGGFKPWMDKKDILPGEVWENSIQKAIRCSDFFLACLSVNSIDKNGWIQREIRDALDMWREKSEDDIYLIPVRLDDCRVPESLRKFQWVNLFEENGWTRLVKAIQAGMERRAKVPADEKLSPGNEDQKVI